MILIAERYGGESQYDQLVCFNIKELQDSSEPWEQMVTTVNARNMIENRRGNRSSTA
jgi:hypothetical protein